MPSFSPAFKEQAVRLLMPPNSQSIPMVSRELSVTVSPLYAWKRQFESKEFAVPAKPSTPDKWNMKSKLAIIIQTASMNEAERAAYCREQGLYPEQLGDWRTAFELADVRDEATAKVALAAAQNQRAANQVVQSRQAQIAGLGLSSGEAFAGNRDVWAKGFGNWANQGDLNNVAGYSVDGGGVAFGFDKQLSLKSNLGISLAYAYSSVSSNSAIRPKGQ